MMAAKVIHSSASCSGHHDDDGDSCCPAARDVGNSTALYQNLRISDWSASLKSLKENPLEASIWIICSHKDVRSIPTATMTVPSSSLDHQAEWKMLPLHAAILYGAPSYVTSEILSAYPNAAREKDLKGRLPIHLAASVGAIVSSSSSAEEDGKRIVTDLVRVYPEALWVPDESGRTAMELVQILQMQNNNDDGGGSSVGQQSQQQQQQQPQQRQQRQQQQQQQQQPQQRPQQQQPQQQPPQEEDCKLKQPAKQQTSQQQPQEEDYKSLYDLLSQG